jgi:hypothetical protein
MGNIFCQGFTSYVPLNILPRVTYINFTPNLTEPAGTNVSHKGDDCNLKLNNLFLNNVGGFILI